MFDKNFVKIVGVTDVTKLFEIVIGEANQACITGARSDGVSEL